MSIFCIEIYIILWNAKCISIISNRISIETSMPLHAKIHSLYENVANWLISLTFKDTMNHPVKVKACMKLCG